MKVIKKFSFFLFLPRKLKRQRASQTQRELFCAVTSIPWSYSGQITCRVLIFHAYSLHHIFTTGAKYNGIDVLSCSLEQSSTVSTAHSGSQTQSKSDIRSASSVMFHSGAYRKGFTLLPVHHCMFSLLPFPVALLQLCLTLQESAEHVPGHSWNTGMRKSCQS